MGGAGAGGAVVGNKDGWINSDGRINSGCGREELGPSAGLGVGNGDAGFAIDGGATESGGQSG